MSFISTCDDEYRASSGWVNHCKVHRCPPTCTLRDTNATSHDLPTNVQFIRYAGSLYRSMQTEKTKQRVFTQYIKAWTQEYPHRDPPVDANGGPALLQDLPEPFEWPSIHPHAPSPGPSLSNPSNLSRPAAPSVAPVAPAVGPSFSNGPPLSPHSPESLSHSGASEALLSHLRTCTVEVDLIPKLSQVRGGLIPRLDHKLVPPRPQRVVFVELPEQWFSKDSGTQGTHLATVQVDLKSYRILKSTVPFSVRRLQTPEGQELPNGQIMVVVPAMVLFHFSFFFSFL